MEWSSGEAGSLPRYLDPSALDFSRFVSGPFMMLFMLVNVVAGLFLVDRVLYKKKRGWQEPLM
jgi:hypothetical protein